MSLDIRYLTNGTKSIYTVRNSGVSPIEFTIHDSVDTISRDMIEHIPKKEPLFCGPDSARMFGVLKVLYPNHGTCNYPNAKNTNCIAESCKHGDEANGYLNCPHYVIQG